MSPIAARRNARIEAAITISKAIRQIKNIPTKRSAQQRPKTVRNFFPPELFSFLPVVEPKTNHAARSLGLAELCRNFLFAVSVGKLKIKMFSVFLNDILGVGNFIFVECLCKFGKNSFFCHNLSSSNNFLTDFANLRYSVLSAAYSSLPSSVSE